jgi:hypothetical protein
MISNRLVVLYWLCVTLVFSTGPAVGQSASTTVPPGTNPAEHAIFPAKDQDANQQMQDQLAAYNWATQQTGWDPYQAYDRLVEQGHVAQQTASQTQGARARGAARGALAGLALGSLAGEAGKGAAIGATAGVMAGGARSRRAQREAQASQQQAIDAFKRQFAEWDKHYVAAMEGKGYTVK